MKQENIEQKRKNNREFMAKRRSDWIAANGPCKHCGSNQKLEVDHINPLKKVKDAWQIWSLKDRNIELAKCQVLCHDCHLKKTKTEGTQRFLHDEVVELRQYVADGTSCEELSMLFNASIARINRVIHGKTFKNV